MDYLKSQLEYGKKSLAHFVSLGFSKTTRTRAILRKTPLKVNSNLKFEIDAFLAVLAVDKQYDDQLISDFTQENIIAICNVNCANLSSSVCDACAVSCQCIGKSNH